MAAEPVDPGIPQVQKDKSRQITPQRTSITFMVDRYIVEIVFSYLSGWRTQRPPRLGGDLRSG